MKTNNVIFFTITLCGSIYERLVFSIFLILPFIKVGLTLENSHINSSVCFKLYSNCISCLIIFITDTILSWMIFLGIQKNHPFLNDFCIKSVVRTDSLLEPIAGIEPATYWLRISCSTDWAILAFPEQYLLYNSFG